MKPHDQKQFERVQKRAINALAKRRIWEREWQRIADVTLPYNVQIYERRGTDKAARIDGEIVNDAPVRSLDALAAGLMARITSPARKWFGMQVTNSGSSVIELDKDAREYLDKVADIIANELQSGNWYATLSLSTYLDMACFGTAAIFMDEQPDGSVVFDAIPIGRFAIDTDHLGRVNTYVREWSATAEQLKDRFGEEKLPQKVLNALKRNDSHTEFAIVHAVFPLDKPTPIGHTFSSTWWMKNDKTEVLSEGGYYEFPALVPRWTVRRGDVYGRGPGWKAHGNIRMLQHFTRGLIQLYDRKMDPPKWMVGGVQLNYLPGTVTNIDVANGEQLQMGDIVTIKAEDIQVTQEVVNGLEEKIDEAFYGNLWRSFTDDDKTGRTATEIEARRQELALLTGPLLESLNGELLEPCIERLYAIMERRKAFGEQPDSLSGAKIRVEFISVMHQMQQSTTLLSVRSFLQDAQTLAGMLPEVIDNLDGDAIIAEMARGNGVRADTMVSKEELDNVRQHKAAAQQQSEAHQSALQATEGIRNVSGADPQKLSDLASALSPAAAAQGGALAPAVAA